jgi:hypothetical protein
MHGLRPQAWAFRQQRHIWSLSKADKKNKGIAGTPIQALGMECRCRCVSGPLGDGLVVTATVSYLGRPKQWPYPLGHSMSHSRAKPHEVGHCLGPLLLKPYPPPPSPDFMQALPLPKESHDGFVSPNTDHKLFGRLLT